VKNNKINKFVIIIFLAISACTSEKSTEENFHTSYTMKENYLEITVRGDTGDFIDFNEAEQKEIAEEVGFIRAVEKLAELIVNINKGILINSEKGRIKDFVFEKFTNNPDEIKITNRDFQKSPGGYLEFVLTITYPVQNIRNGQLISEVKEYEMSITDGSGEEYFTGLIIDVSGFDEAAPVSQSFQIYSNDGSYVFGLEAVDVELLLEGEGVHYAKDIYTAVHMEDVIGNNPYVVTVYNVIELVKDKIIISERDAQVVRKHNGIAGFLEKGKIVIVK